LIESANQGIIHPGDEFLPFGRQEIAGLLHEISRHKEELNKRQQQELSFYLRAYRLELSSNYHAAKDFDFYRNDSILSVSLIPPGIFYKDVFFTFALKPVLGYHSYNKSLKDNVIHSYGGAEAYAYAGKHWGFYASLRDNHESSPLALSSFFTQHQGGAFKGSVKGGVDYSEMRGGISYSWNWGRLSLKKDHLIWGSQYHGSNIFSGRQPSFAFIELDMKPVKWFEFRYFHAWLVSDVIDSTQSYYLPNTHRDVMHDKYLAANMFTIIPFKGLRFSAGNSIIYSDIGLHPAYLIPFLFYKSVDHTLNSTSNYAGQNSQFFLNLSIRPGLGLHLYGSCFVDELSFERWGDSDEHNFYSYKAGLAFMPTGKSNLALMAEYTRTSPFTYQHFLPTLSFTSNQYLLGHYLGDNSCEYYLCVRWKPIRGLSVKTTYTKAIHGNSWVYGDTPQPVRKGFMEEISWQQQLFSVEIQWEALSNLYLDASLNFIDTHSYGLDGLSAEDIMDIYTPAFFQDNACYLDAGIHVSF